MPLSVTSPVDQGDLALGLSQLLRDDAAIAVLILDQELRVHSASPNAAVLLGLAETRLAGLPVHALPPLIRELVERAAHAGEAASSTEFLERSPQPGQSLRVTALPVRGAAGEAYTAVLVQELRPAQQLQGDLRQLDRLAGVGTLAAEMAHEVKNALVAVKTFVDLLLEKNPGDELEATVHREMRRIDAIVGQVLKYSRNSASKPQATSLHTVLERTLKMMRSHFSGKSITLVTRLAATPDVILGDENHLEQAFMNLLLNATEAMNGEGTLSIETDTLAGPVRQIRLVIRDTGGGIPAEALAHLFEPFYTTKQHGTGLGLAITRRIIHEHHGIISAESEPGKGTAFNILLPAS